MRALALVLMLLPSVTRGDGGVTVPLPDLSGFSPRQADELLAALVEAVVVGENCEGYFSTDGEWTLLIGSADILAYQVLGLSMESYDAGYWDAAFASLDDPTTCGREGPKVQGLLRLLEDLGGSRVPIGPAKG